MVTRSLMPNRHSACSRARSTAPGRPGPSTWSAGTTRSSGDQRRAVAYCQRSLDLCRKLGLSHTEAEAWQSLGYAHHHLGDHARAISCCRNAIRLQRELGARIGRALTLTHLGDIQHDARDQQAAGDAWQEALALLADIDDPKAADVRGKLELLGAGGSSGP